MTYLVPVPDSSDTKPATRKSTLIAACTAHATHDGLSDLVYVFLPVWQDMFMLGYVGLSLLRSAYALTLAVLQIPATSLSARIRPAKLLVLSTVITALGWLLAGLAGSGIALGAALVVAGVGASVQHPIASGLVSRAYGKAAKRPLGLYNFAGDVGKSLLPASAAALLAYAAYRDVVMVYAGVGLCAAWIIGSLLKNTGTLSEHSTSQKNASTVDGLGNPFGFRALLVTAVLDSAVRMGFLTFLPFVIKAHGGSLAQTGLSLTLVFIGGAIGKFCCGWMADAWGSARTIMLTEVATAVLIVAVLVAPLTVAMLVLPLLGVVLNGTSSVLYGAVTDVVEAPGLEKAFSIFYTGTIGSGALAPVLYGYVGDHANITVAVTVIAITAAVSFLPVTVMAARHRDLFEQPR